LTHTNNVRLEFGNVIDTSEGSMFVVHAPEDDCVATLNPDHGTITESDCVMDVDVKLGEGVARTGHVIGGTRVHHPPGLCSC
jgi:hypothetical protein